MKIAIVGAGAAGLACARTLADAGMTPVVLDKGRGIGGRLATRRANGQLQFDHGAQYATARDKGFAALLAQAEAAGATARWDIGAEAPANDRFVGLPGMSGLAKFMGAGLDLHLQTQVEALRPDHSGWQVTVAQTTTPYDKVVCTAPAPQIAALIGADHALVPTLEKITYDPCLTLMVSLERHPNGAEDGFIDREGDLSWIARDSAKPGRPQGGECWVAQASPAWSRAHLELDNAAMTAKLVEAFCEVMSVSAQHISHASAHRWRYARVATPLGQPFARSADGHFYAGGDGFLGPRVEAAYLSGRAIAEAILTET